MKLNLRTFLILFAAISFLATACKKEEEPPTVLSGCTDAIATNYDATATSDDGSCTFGIVGGAWITDTEEIDIINEEKYLVISDTKKIAGKSDLMLTIERNSNQPYTWSVGEVKLALPVAEPVKTILGYVVLFLLVVIRIFLSEFAIVLLLYYKIFFINHILISHSHNFF